jgi:hypothetical protein
MSVTAPAPRSSAFARALVAAALCLPACDKLTGGDKEEAKSDDGAAKTATDEEAKKKAAEEEAKKKAAGDEDAKKKAAEEEEAKKKAALADEDAKKKAAEEEAKKKAEEDAKKPVLLSDITINAAGGMFGGGAGALKVDAKAKFNEAINTGTYVHMKALCKKDARVFSDVAQVGLVDYSKQLHQFTAGETTALSGSIFTQGIDSAMSPCQFDFRLGAGYGGVSVPLATVCYDGAAKLGACDPPIAAAAMSGSSLPIDVADLTVKADASYGGTPGIAINEVLQINKAINENAQLVVKSACTSGTQKFVDTQFPYLGAGPFKYEPGESLSRPVRMYWNPAFAFTEAPKVCDVTFMLRQQKTGSWTEYEETVLKRGCFKDEKVIDGACDPAAPPAPADAALTAASTTIDGVKLDLVAPYGAGPNQFNVKVQADVTIKTPVDQNGMIESNVTCKVGSTSRVEKTWFSGVDLHYLDVGETTRMSGTAFSSEALAGNPKTCEVVFTAGNRMGGAGATPVELARWCLKKGKLKAGKC